MSRRANCFSRYSLPILQSIISTLVPIAGTPAADVAMLPRTLLTLRRRSCLHLRLLKPAQVTSLHCNSSHRTTRFPLCSAFSSVAETRYWQHIKLVSSINTNHQYRSVGLWLFFTKLYSHSTYLAPFIPLSAHLFHTYTFSYPFYVCTVYCGHLYRGSQTLYLI